MKVYEKPFLSITEFNNRDDSMVLVSGNYNPNNLQKSTNINVINF